VARLMNEVEAKASPKGRESPAGDTKPDDLLVSRRKFFERRMDVRTSVVYMHLDDLRVGVKSQSNLAMACSCRNMPQYSLPVLRMRGTVRIKPADRFRYGVFFQLRTCVLHTGGVAGGA